MSRRILVVEDERDLADLLSYNLSREGYSVDIAATGTAALERIRERKPDLVLLDLMLPDVPGTDVCRRVKGDPTTQHIPVVMVTARSEEIDRIVGFELGADDYVTKPFSVRELLLRVKAILRRDRAGAPAVGGGILRCGRIRVDTERHRVEVDGKEIQLTVLELRLLSCLLERAGRVQTRDVLLSDVWGLDADVETRTVDAHVKRLRRKLGAAGDCVETVRGVGYRVREEEA